MTERYFPGSTQKIRYDSPEPEGEEEWRKRGKEVPLPGGKVVRLYRITDFAFALERTSQTIRRWEKNGTLPKATFQKTGQNVHGKRRLYSEAQIEGTVKIARDLGLLPHTGRRDLDLSAFAGRVLDLFRQLARGDR